MGQYTLKRVALDFKADLDEVWPGYLNPFADMSVKCDACDGDGASPDMRFLNQTWYRHIAREMFGAFFGDAISSVWSEEKLRRAGWSEEVIANIARAKKFGFTHLTHWSDKLHEDEIKALVDAGRLSDLTSTWSRETGWVKKVPAVYPTPEQVNHWAAHGLGHDSLNCWIAAKARAKRGGIDLDDPKQTKCAVCNGDGSIWNCEQAKKDYENWKPTEPPAGPGYQLWETVTEGSPQSPVFDTPEKLAAWCVDNATMFAGRKGTYEEWLDLIREDALVLTSTFVATAPPYDPNAK